MMETEIFTGHHGTSKDNAELILKTNFTINHVHQGWLGKGIYFFEDNQYLAQEYAENRHDGKIIRVIQSELEVKKEEVFDTTLPENENLFHRYREELVIRLKEANNLRAKVRNDEDLDGKVYDTIVRSKGISLIRSKTYTPPNRERKLGLPFSRVPNGIELCLKNPRNVKTKCSI